MDVPYKKSKGGAGSKGTDFQIHLLSVFLLNAVQKLTGWQLSTEDQSSGKFDDVVLKLSDHTAILLQAKHKDKKRITLDQLLSTSSKTDDFSLPKYFFSYQKTKTESTVKHVIICTNTNADKNALKFLRREDVCRESMLYYEDGTYLFTCTDELLPWLIENAKIYYENNLRNKKEIDETAITEENMKDFMRHLQIYLNYPSESTIEKVIDKLLSHLKFFSNLWGKTSVHDIYRKVKDWFQNPIGVYLTEIRVKAMFSEIRSEKYCEKLDHYNLHFEQNNLNFARSKRMFHVVTDGEYLLHTLKVHNALHDRKNVVLYANPDDGLDVQKHIIDAFALTHYCFLVIVWPKISQISVINEICVTLKDILLSRQYKKVILVAESKNKLVQRMRTVIEDNYVEKSIITLEHITNESQDALLKRRNVKFQGKNVSVEELVLGQITRDLKKSVSGEILEKLVVGDEISVGTHPLDLDEDISQYYVTREFKRKIVRSGESMVEIVPEESLIDIEEKIILISGAAGMGKSTVLTKLSLLVKEKYPELWVFKIELDSYTGILKKRKGTGVITLTEVLAFKEASKLRNEFEEYIFSMPGKVALLMDGLDEIVPDYSDVIFDLIAQCQNAANIRKVFITARTHVTEELEEKLNVKPFLLEPFTQGNQTDFLMRYWAHHLKLPTENEENIETRIHNMLVWVQFYTVGNSFGEIPLQIRMLAEVSLEESVQTEAKDWQGLHLKTDKGTTDRRDKLNLVKLYQMFLEKKRNVFIDQRNPSENRIVLKALMHQFEECLTYHRSLALEIILDQSKCAHFTRYRKIDEDNEIDALTMGIVQKTDSKLCFVHLTFAEYFFAESLIKELQLQNQSAQFQTVLMDVIFLNPKYESALPFLDGFLQKNLHSLTANSLDNYKPVLCESDESRLNLLHQLAGKGYTATIQFLLRCVNFETIRNRNVKIEDIKIYTNKEFLNVLHSLLRRGGLNIIDSRCRTPLHYAVEGGHFETVKFLVEHGADVNFRRSSYKTLFGLSSSVEQIDTILRLAIEFNRYKIVEFLIERGADLSAKDDDGRTPLHYTVENGNRETIRFLLKRGADIGVKAKNGRTPLHVATMRNQRQTVELLIEYNADIAVKDNNGRTPLHIAVSRNMHDMVEFFVKRGADVNVKDNEGQTPLHYAAGQGQLDTVKCLVKYRADINVKNNDGQSPLHLAATRGQHEIVQFLIERGADYAGEMPLHSVSGSGQLKTRGTYISVRDNYGHTPMHFAALLGQHEIMEYLLKSGASISVKDDKGQMPLHLAASEGHLEAVKFLVERGADITARTNGGCTSLHLAASGGHHEVVEFLLNSGADASDRSSDGWTSLHFAADINQVEVLEVLLEHGVDINARNNEGQTTLHLAVAAEESQQDVRFLLERGANFTVEDNNKRTPLHIAALHGHLEAVKLLVRCGADTTVEDNNAWTPLHLAAGKGQLETVKYLLECDADISSNKSTTPLHFAAVKGDLETVKLLVECGADVNVLDNEGQTPLHLAADQAHLETVKYLLERGADVSVQIDDINTPLNLAAGSGRLEIVQLLVEHGADVSGRSKLGLTPLHFAADSGRQEIMEFLVELGADISVKDDEDQRPLHFAAGRGRLETVKFLVERGACISVKNLEGHTPLHFAAFNGNFETMEFLVEHGAEISAKDNDGHTSLHFASGLGRVEVVEFLVQHGGDISVESNDGQTPLHFASERGQSEIVTFLLQRGADISVKDNKGQIPLHFAASQGDLETVKLLVERGVDISVKDNKGQVPLHLAAGQGQFEVVEFLVQRGADVSVTNSDGRTPLHFAAARGQHETVEFLLERGADIRVKDDEGRTPLHFAADQAQLQTVKYLIERGADISVKDD